MRRRIWSPHSQTTRPAYSSAIDPPSHISTISARLPTLVLVISFILGWIIGENDTSRKLVISLANGSFNNVKSVGNNALIFMGLAVRQECISEDGVGGNIAYCSSSQLLGKLMREQVILQQRMQSAKEYGEYYHQIFNDITTRPTNIFPAVEEDQIPLTSSRYGTGNKQAPLFYARYFGRRLKRRILMKHMQAVMLSKSSSEIADVTFTWVTAGDGAAAAHGNLYSQSYTAIIQDTVESSFEAIGVRFEAKNYGMGQYSSGPELSLCMNEVFGDDIDVLMWDFASLQPEPVHKTILWGAVSVYFCSF